MHSAFKTALESGKTDQYTIDEFIAYLVDSEYDDRQTRKIDRHITQARFRYKALVEQIHYDASRNLDKNRMLRYANCSFISSG